MICPARSVILRSIVAAMPILLNVKIVYSSESFKNFEYLLFYYLSAFVLIHLFFAIFWGYKLALQHLRRECRGNPFRQRSCYPRIKRLVCAVFPGIFFLFIQINIALEASKNDYWISMLKTLIIDAVVGFVILTVGLIKRY